MTYPKQGVTATLYPMSTINTPEGVAVSSTTSIATGVTDVNGEITFPNVPTGIYFMKVLPPFGYSIVSDHSENGISDGTPGDDQIDQISGNIYIVNVQVTKDTLSTAKVVIAKAINVTLIMVWVNPTSYSLQLTCSVVAPVEISLTVDSYVMRNYSSTGIYEESLKDASDTSVLVIPIGAFVSNISTIDIGTVADGPIKINDRLSNSFSAKSPGRVVVSQGNMIFTS